MATFRQPPNLVVPFYCRFVYKIPKSIEPKYAGPLMCAGSTVFSAMYGANLSPTARIAIVGIGGNVKVILI